MIAFSQPELLWSLLLLPAYYLLRRRHIRADVIAYPPLQYKNPATRARFAAFRLPLEITILVVALLGVAGPYRETEIELLDDPGIDVQLALDVSLSMLAEDFPPNRLTALQRTARDFLDRSSGHRVGLVIFAGDAYVQSPLTTNRAVLGELLDGVTVHAMNQHKSGGTAVGDALLVAVERLEKSRPEMEEEQRDQAIILITDGESNLGVDPIFAAQFVRELGIRLYIIGIGGSEPMPIYHEGRRIGGGDYVTMLDDTQLRAVAEAADGLYFRALDLDALTAVFAELAHLESAPLERRVLKRREPFAGHFSMLLVPLFWLHLLLGGLVLRRPLR